MTKKSKSKKNSPYVSAAVRFSVKDMPKQTSRRRMLAQDITVGKEVHVSLSELCYLLVYGALDSYVRMMPFEDEEMRTVVNGELAKLSALVAGLKMVDVSNGDDNNGKG